MTDWRNRIIKYAEVSPGYVAVALERFAVATGIAPVRIENAPAEAEAVGV